MLLCVCVFIVWKFWRNISNSRTQFTFLHDHFLSLDTTNYVGTEIFMVVTIKNTIFRDVAPWEYYWNWLLEEHVASIFREERLCKLGTMLAVTIRLKHSVKKHYLFTLWFSLLVNANVVLSSLRRHIPSNHWF
jgi:hypothetical protein